MTQTRLFLAVATFAGCLAAGAFDPARAGELSERTMSAQSPMTVQLNSEQLNKGQPSPVHKQVVDIYDAALALLRAGKFEEGFTKIGEEDALEGKTVPEQEAVDRLKFALALRAGKPQAQDLLEKLPDLPDPTKATYMLELAGQYQSRNEWQSAIAAAKRYLALGGPETEMAQGVIWRGYYTLHDFSNALSASLEALATKEKNGTKPEEVLLKAIRSEATQVNDRARVTLALSKSAAYYPTPANWNNLIADAMQQPGFPADALAIDIFRLMRATDSLSNPGQYHDYMVLALQLGIPEEAKAVLDFGTAKGAVSPANLPDLPRLRDKVLADTEANLKSLANSEHDNVKASNGEALVRSGLCYAALGKYDEAIPLMEHGIAKGAQDEELLRLRLGTVYLAAGLKDKAANILSSLKHPGTADLARVWLVKLNQAG
jgi:tetratricopeptide (TPR) repeat protein